MGALERNTICVKYLLTPPGMLGQQREDRGLVKRERQQLQILVIATLYIYYLVGYMYTLHWSHLIASTGRLTHRHTRVEGQ